MRNPACAIAFRMNIRQHASPNFDARPAGIPIDMLVLHYTGMESGEAALDRLCDPSAKVSAHYFIGEDGSVLRLVDEGRRAWHAGVSFWRGETDINGRSIGIELVNPGHEFGYRPFPAPQMSALMELAADLVRRHDIPARNIVGHADVAPARKMDPGELFDWRQLAGSGIGLWPDPAAVAEPGGVAELAAIGYDTTDERAAVTAFQRHFRPSQVDGILDEGTSRAIGAVHRLAVLTAAD